MKTIYQRQQNPGRLWIRTGVELGPYQDTSPNIINALVSISPSTSSELLTGIKQFEMFFDTSMIVTPNWIFLSKIKTNYETGEVYTTVDDTHQISLSSSYYVGSWIFAEDKTVTIAKLLSCAQDFGTQIRPILYSLNLESGDMTYLYNEITDASQYYYNFISIDSATLTFDSNKNVYNVSFTASTSYNSGMYIGSINIKNLNNIYTIISSKVIEPIFDT